MQIAGEEMDETGNIVSCTGSNLSNTTYRERENTTGEALGTHGKGAAGVSGSFSADETESERATQEGGMDQGDDNHSDRSGEDRHRGERRAKFFHKNCFAIEQPNDDHAEDCADYNYAKTVMGCSSCDCNGTSRGDAIPPERVRSAPPSSGAEHLTRVRGTSSADEAELSVPWVEISDEDAEGLVPESLSYSSSGGEHGFQWEKSEGEERDDEDSTRALYCTLDRAVRKQSREKKEDMDGNIDAACYSLVDGIHAKEKGGEYIHGEKDGRQSLWNTEGFGSNVEADHCVSSCRGDNTGSRVICGKQYDDGDIDDDGSILEMVSFLERVEGKEGGENGDGDVFLQKKEKLKNRNEGESTGMMYSVLQNTKRREDDDD